jgi:hypothetical protein
MEMTFVFALGFSLSSAALIIRALLKWPSTWIRKLSFLPCMRIASKLPTCAPRSTAPRRLFVSCEMCSLPLQVTSK